MQKKKPLNVDEKKPWYKNGEWGRDMIKKIRLEKIRIVMVSEDILWKQKKNSLLNVNIVSEDIYSKKRRLQ